MTCSESPPRPKARATTRSSSPGWCTGPMPSRVAFVAALAAAWVRLRRKPAAERRLAMVLSDYPGRAGREAYAVGLDTWASVAAICEDLRAARGMRSPSCQERDELIGRPDGHLSFSRLREKVARRSRVG